MLSRKTSYFCLGLTLACQALSSHIACGQQMPPVEQIQTDSQIHWAPDVPTARKASMEYKVPVVIHFYGDNCLPCKVLEQNVLSRSEVIETLNKYFICVRVNASRDRETAAQYGVHSWPTDVFISPDGKTLDQSVCKQSAQEYLGVLHGIAVMNRDRNAMLASHLNSQAQQVTTQIANYAQPQANAAANGGTANGQAAPALAGQTSGLPPAGQLAQGNPQGPNFYTQGAGTERQQLPHSLGPNADVNSGPMLSQNQPQALTTAVQAAGNQIASPSQQHALNTTLGQLPPMNTTAQVGPNLPSHNTHPLAGAMSTAPSLPAIAASTTMPTANAWNQPQTAHSTASPSQMLDNPHFNPHPASSPSGAVATPAATPVPAAATPVPAVAAKVPASTASFQPRAALANDNPQANQQATAMASQVVSESSAIALDGYCPVALKHQGNWIAGQPQFAVKHRGRIYHLSSQAAMSEFLQHPDRCSPVMSGYDAMAFLNEGKLVEGSIQYGLHDQSSGNILLFTSAESKQAYEQNFDRNTQALQIVLQNAGIVP